MVSVMFLAVVVAALVFTGLALSRSGVGRDDPRLRELEDRVAVLEAEQRELSRLVSDAVIQSDEAARFDRLAGQPTPATQLEAGSAGGGEEAGS